MPSALATQLAASASLNASLLQDRSKNRQVDSYLFTGRDAQAHDLDSIYALASNAYSQLSTLSSAFSSRTVKAGSDGTPLAVDFEQTLFSDAAKGMDRTLQTREANANLDRTLNAFLALLGPWLMEIPTSKVLEWLVRRFRVNEFNIDALLSLFLPYHESPHFVKMLSILHIQPTSPFSFLLAFKSTAKPLPRSSLVKAMLSNTEVARFTAELLPTAVKCSQSHRTLLAFNAATMHDYLSNAPSLDDGTLAFVLPALLSPLQASQKETNITLDSYLLLSILSQKVNLTPAAICTIIGAMARMVRGSSNKSSVSTVQFVKAAIAICSPQDEVKDFSVTGQLCSKMPGFANEMSKAMVFVGAEKFLLPLLQSLCSHVHEHRVSSLFSAVINSQNIPEAAVRRVASMLTHLVVSTKGEGAAEAEERTTSAARSLLFLMHQRRPDILRGVADDILAAAGGNSGEKSDNRKERKERRGQTNELLASFSLSHPLAQSSNVNEIVVASASTEKAIRVDAVKRLYSTLGDAEERKNMAPSDMASIQSALLGRVYDTHPGVLHALYDSPSVFLSTVVPATTPQELLEILTSQFLPTPPARAVLHAHAAFLAGPFTKTYPEYSSAVQQNALFPFLLASKGKFRTSRGVWDAIKAGGGFQTGWLHGCLEVWNEAQLLDKDKERDHAKEDEDESVERIYKVNLAVADKIAGNVLASDDSQDIDLILSKLHDPLPHARALSYLVCRAMLMRASRDQKVRLACQILRAMHLTTLDTVDDLSPESSLEEVLSEHQIGTKATMKPGGRGTASALQASVLVLITALAVPTDFSAPWISVLPSELEGRDISQQYVSLMQDVYILASSSATAAPDHLSTLLLRAVFLNLKDSSLAFLFGILLAMSPAAERVRTHALLHVLAFLRGHAQSNTVDFQAVLPSFIALLLDVRTDKRNRALIFECIALLGSTSEKKHVYGLDTIYGSVSSQLEYLDTKDLTKYVTALTGNRDQLVQDASYIKVFHRQHFEAANTKYKRRLLCFLLSHVIAHPFPLARIAILRSIEAVAGSPKSHMLLPVVKELSTDSVSVSQMFGSSFDEYESLVIAGFMEMTPSDLNSKDSESWPVLVTALRAHFQSNSNTAARTQFASALERRLFTGLELEKRSEVCVVLLKVGGEGGEAYPASKTLLGKLLRDVPLIVHLLSQFQPPHVEHDAPLSKRARFDKASGSSETDLLQPLTLLAEILGTTELPGSLDLISHLLDTLSKVIRSESWGPSDTNYVCQMLMAAIEKSANKISGVLARPIRLDVLVEVIRVSDNPQTFHEALLLMANLARLTPDSVLHNIMPIFTFMGSNVFHRDDTYSFKVVQNTIDSIVPVMASSLKAKHSSGPNLYIGARDFLRIFTEASNHIPRHRRQKFFVHLAEVLGSQDFLAPICMLLVDKVANRVSRQNAEEARATLGLPISLLRHFPASVQIFVLTEALRECLRLTSRLTTPTNVNDAFLDYTRDEEHSSSTLSTLKRRVQALILFSSTCLVPSVASNQIGILEGGSTTDLVRLFVGLATLHTGQTQEGELADIVTAAQAAIGRVMNVIPAAEFLSGALVLLQSPEPRIKAGALEIISERILAVTETVRQQHQATMIQIIDLIRDIITRQSAGALVEAALGALKSIGSTCCPGEESALLATLPLVIKVVRSRTSAGAAIVVLPCYILALGPRIIPYFKEIVQECVCIHREVLKGKKQLAPAAEIALLTLQSLLVSLPAFYGSTELSEMAKVYIDYSATSSQYNPLTGLMKNIAKRTSAEVLLPVLYELWPSLGKAATKDDVNGMIGYFTLLRRTLQAAPRAAALEHLRQLFKVFMEALDINMTFGSKEGEPYVISAFTELVVKLNENAFRPLFRRLHDWAFTDDKSDNKRRITFCHLYTALLDYFKGLMNPYMSTLLLPLAEVLQSFITPLQSYSESDTALWSGVIQTFTKSLENDDGVFWREDKLATILPRLVSQLPTVIHLPAVSTADAEHTPKALLTASFLSLLSALPTSSSDLLKRLNMDLLMHTRSEDARLRVLGLECVGELWKADGGKLIGFVAETATFISECAEDENDTVVREAHNLKNAVESVAGSISGL